MDWANRSVTILTENSDLYFICVAMFLFVLMSEPKEHLGSLIIGGLLGVTIYAIVCFFYGVFKKSLCRKKTN